MENWTIHGEWFRIRKTWKNIGNMKHDEFLTMKDSDLTDRNGARKKDILRRESSCNWAKWKRKNHGVPGD